MERPHRPISTMKPDSAEAVTRTIPQAASGSSTDATLVGPESLPEHLGSIQFWQVGRQVGEFTLLSKLGEGGLGTVYLAHQQSLNRTVALKVTDAAVAGTGEGLALAGLEHEHIVKVYSGFVEPVTGKHCLCLQYVPGTSLSAAIGRLHESGAKPKSGQDILDAIDSLSKAEIAFDPSALADRQTLASDDFPAAVCRLGEQLASALAFAHGRDFLHCDVKPGNILLTPYGRPMLVDFNISVNAARGATDAVGGTPKYMAPEQHDAYCGKPHDPLNHRIDIYSLGVVLFELMSGSRPTAENAHLVRTIPRELVVVLRRCLEVDPKERYESAAELASALAGARQLIAARRQLPKPGWLGALAIRRPLTTLLALALIPHVVATLLNIAYNAVQIELNETQMQTFARITVTYNCLIYLVCVTWGVRLLRKFHRMRTQLLAGDIRGPDADFVRADSLTFGYRGNVFAFAGWVPGGILFPLLLDRLAGPLPWNACLHFGISFALSGLVGMVYSYYGIQFVVLRALYPQLGNPESFDANVVREEVRKGTRWLEPFLILATLIPLAGAILLIAFAGETISLGFRLLVTGLIVLGMLGVTGLVRVQDRLAALLAPWMRSSDDRQPAIANWSAVWRNSA